MKNFLSIIGAFAVALAVFAAIAVIVKKVKFKFIISSADSDEGMECDYDCTNCDAEDCDERWDDDIFDDWDDIPVEEPEIEFELTEDVAKDVKDEVEDELGK